MAEKSDVIKQVVKNKGYFNYSELYLFCYNFLKDEGYKISEDQYQEKVTSFGKEILIKWTAKKKVTEYFANQIKLDWHILGMKDAEIERDGQKESTNKGEVKLTFDADLVHDYEERWEGQPFWKFLRGIYEKYVIRTTVDEYEDRLEDIAEEFVEQTKAFLALEGRR